MDIMNATEEKSTAHFGGLSAARPPRDTMHNAHPARGPWGVAHRPTEGTLNLPLPPHSGGGGEGAVEGGAAWVAW